MPEPLLFLAVATIAAVVVAMPILLENPDHRAPPLPAEDRDALALRHRIAIEALRDVEADRRAGSLDEATYRAELLLAEQRAVAARAALDAASDSSQPRGGRDGRLVAGGIGVVLGVLLVAGVVVRMPVDLANATVTNRALAEQMERSAARDAQIAELRARLVADPQDAEALAALADVYLASGTQADRNAAAPLLLLLTTLEPENTEALAKLATAYLQSGQPDDAAAAVDRVEELDPASADIPFFRGLIARQRGDEAAAVAAFDAFLAAAPDDERAAMVASLRAELTGGEPMPSPTPAS
jgi:cytochrome c-type biogenesis protein CcmH/NrfG